jgi:hypothetical protein
VEGEDGMSEQEVEVVKDLHLIFGQAVVGEIYSLEIN